MDRWCWSGRRVGGHGNGHQTGQQPAPDHSDGCTGDDRRYGGGVSGASRYRELGEAGWAWVLGQVRHDDGPWLPEVVGDDPPRPAEDRDSLYAGIAGLAPVLAELG